MPGDPAGLASLSETNQNPAVMVLVVAGQRVLFARAAAQVDAAADAEERPGQNPERGPAGALSRLAGIVVQ